MKKETRRLGMINLLHSKITSFHHAKEVFSRCHFAAERSVVADSIRSPWAKTEG